MTAKTHAGDLPPLTLEELVDELDHEAQVMLGISGEEFRRRFDAGELPESRAVEHLAFLLDIVRARTD